MKRKLILSAFLTLILLPLFTAQAFAKDYSFPQISFVVNLTPEGTALIEEKRTFNFDGQFSWAEEFINKSQKGATFQNFQISSDEGAYINNNSQRWKMRCGYTKMRLNFIGN